MTRSLYSKFILGYLIFGLLGFLTIATFSSRMVREHLVQERADALYDEAHMIAASYSNMYQGERQDAAEVSTQIRILAQYLRAEIWIVNRQGTIIMDSLAEAGCRRGWRNSIPPPWETVPIPSGIITGCLTMTSCLYPPRSQATTTPTDTC